MRQNAAASKSTRNLEGYKGRQFSFKSIDRKPGKTNSGSGDAKPVHSRCAAFCSASKRSIRGNPLPASHCLYAFATRRFTAAEWVRSECDLVPEPRREALPLRQKPCDVKANRFALVPMSRMPSGSGRHQSCDIVFSSSILSLTIERAASRSRPLRDLLTFGVASMAR